MSSLIEITVNTKKGKKVNQHRCTDKEFTIGRDRNNLVVLHGWLVEAVHARVEKQDNGIYINANSAKAKISINNQKIKQYGPITSSDVIRIGDYHIHVSDRSNEKQLIKPPKPSNQNISNIESTKAKVNAVIKTSSDSGSKALSVNGADVVTPESINDSDKKLSEKWRGSIHRKLFEIMDLRRVNISDMSDEELREYTKNAINEILPTLTDFPKQLDKQSIAKQVLAEAVGLGPLEDLLEREDISEVMVNAHDEIFYEESGKLKKSVITFTDDSSVISAIERIVSPLGRRIDESSPMVDARLKDGSRVNAIIPPLALKGPCITIRKFMKERLTAQHLINFGSVDRSMVDFLNMAIKFKRNVVISGGTGSGKTTLLNVLSNFIPEDERIVTVEDAAELKLYQPNLVSLEARPANQEGKGAVPIRDLVKNCLRMRPDRIVVGECRGGEALDMLQAMNTGHDGSLTTIHANSPRDCIGRLEVLVLMSGMDLPVRAIREQISSAVNMIVQQTRFSCGTRKVTSISEVTGVEGETVQIAEIFKFKQTGFDEKGKVAGHFESTGLVPEFYENLRKRGISVDMSIFDGGALG
jgi:pilus assembly protein CpaF